MVAANNPHDDKFASFYKMIRETKAKGIKDLVVHHPEVLGDDYTELVANLNALADAELRLVIVPTKDRQFKKK